MAKLIVVDGNSIVNRAFYGIMGNRMLQTVDGIYTNAVYGFLAILFKELEEVKPDYIIGSVHYVKAPDGNLVAVDISPENLADGIRAHFEGSVEAYIRAYFAQEREMIAKFDFDIIGHPDLVRKFNAKSPYFNENDVWYVEELVKTADVIAASGKIVEVNTGAISRGWLDDAYPSRPFRDLLRERGVKFVLNSDSHSAEAVDCAFDRFAKSENFVTLFD